MRLFDRTVAAATLLHPPLAVACVVAAALVAAEMRLAVGPVETPAP